MMRGRGKTIGSLAGLLLLAGCGEPVFENAGSQVSLLEDREACASEIDKSSSASAYRRNPDAHPEYPMEVFFEMNRCIERRGWKQVRSQHEQEQLRDAIAAEAGRQAPPSSISDAKATDSFARAVEQRLARQTTSKNE